jgi:hypothetical protein
MRIHLVTLTFAAAISCGPAVAQTAYGSCPERAETYQQRYLSNGRTSDLVCMQHALERELGGSGPASAYNCPRTSQHYQDRYMETGNTSDLVCMQEALERELR